MLPFFLFLIYYLLILALKSAINQVNTKYKSFDSVEYFVACNIVCRLAVVNFTSLNFSTLLSINIFAWIRAFALKFTFRLMPEIILLFYWKSIDIQFRFFGSQIIWWMFLLWHNRNSFILNRLTGFTTLLREIRYVISHSLLCL